MQLIRKMNGTVLDSNECRFQNNQRQIIILSIKFLTITIERYIQIKNYAFLFIHLFMYMCVVFGKSTVCFQRFDSTNIRDALNAY